MKNLLSSQMFTINFDENNMFYAYDYSTNM